MKIVSKDLSDFKPKFLNKEKTEDYSTDNAVNFKNNLVVNKIKSDPDQVMPFI